MRISNCIWGQPPSVKPLGPVAFRASRFSNTRSSVMHCRYQRHSCHQRKPLQSKWEEVLCTQSGALTFRRISEPMHFSLSLLQTPVCHKLMIFVPLKNHTPWGVLGLGLVLRVLRNSWNSIWAARVLSGSWQSPTSSVVARGHLSCPHLLAFPPF